MLNLTLKSKFICCLLLMVCYSASAQAASYNLNCRLGGHMGMTYDSRTKTVTGNFTATTAGTRDRALGLGQCSWIDRPIRGNEPRKFCQRKVNDVIVKVNARSYSLHSRKAPYLAQVKQGGYFSLRVTSKNGCLDVVRVNRFKKARTISGR